MVKGGVRNIFCSLCFSELPYQKERAQKRDERVNASQNDNRSRVARLYGRRVRRELSGSQIVALTLLSARFAVSRCGMLTERSLAALGLSWCPSLQPDMLRPRQNQIIVRVRCEPRCGIDGRRRVRFLRSPSGVQKERRYGQHGDHPHRAAAAI